MQDLHQLLQGLYGPTSLLRSSRAEPRVTTCTVQLGDLNPLRLHLTNRIQRQRVSLSSSGAAIAEERARFLSLVEGLERYSTCMFSDEQFRWATARELGREAIDLDLIPRCSPTELKHPKCVLRAPDKRSPMRWVSAVNLLDGSIVYVPAVMVYLHTGYASLAERIALPITTGCAAHVTYEEALINGLLEVIERDAISIVWLQKLGLPRIEIDEIPPVLEPYWAEYQRSSCDIEYFFFDATMDLGIPTIYGIQVATNDEHACTIVSCSTDIDPAAALAKTIRDMCSIRLAFRTARSYPESFDDYREIFDGAAYMAHRDRRGAFDFLLKSKITRKLSEMKRAASDCPQQQLASLVDILRRKNLHAYAVDLTTDEGLRSGFRVVRVLIPGLQPLSFHYRTRYCGHSRLYKAPERMGYSVRTENELNEWPQPFA